MSYHFFFSDATAFLTVTIYAALCGRYLTFFEKYAQTFVQLLDPLIEMVGVLIGQVSYAASS